jgi:hypothetical protein
MAFVTRLSKEIGSDIPTSFTAERKHADQPAANSCSGFGRCSARSP